MITYVNPKARMATTAACTPTFSRFWLVKKSGVAMNIATQTTTSPTKAPLSARKAAARWRTVGVLSCGVLRVGASADTSGLDLLDREGHHGILSCFGGGHFSDDATTGHDHDTVTDAQHLRELAGGQ